MTEEPLAPPRRTPGRVLLDALLVLGFLALCAGPGLRFALVREDEQTVLERIRATERRAPHPAPDVPGLAEVDRWPATFERWFLDRTPWRDELLGLRARGHLVGLHALPGDEMLLGRQRWCFPDEGRFVDEARGALPMHPELLAAWVDLFRERDRIARELGLRYVLLIGPSKAAIYPDHLPATHRVVGPSQRAQLLPALAEAGIEAPDLLPLLLEERAQDQPGEVDFVVHPTGTHWRMRGDRVVYEAVARALGLEPLPRSQWQRVPPLATEDDGWSERLHLTGLLPEPPQRDQPERPLAQRAPIPRVRIAETLERGGQGAPIQMFHDSYGRELRELLALHRPVRSVWSLDWDVDRMAASGADVVIDVWVDRRLIDNDPRAMAPVTPEERARRFAGGRPLPLDGPGLLAAARGAVGARLVREPDGALGATPPEGGRDPFAGWVGIDFSGLPDPGEDALLAVHLRVPGPGLVELRHPRGRKDTAAAWVSPADATDGQAVVHLPVLAARWEDEHFGLLLPAEPGWAVTGLELRGIGELRPRPGSAGDPRRFGRLAPPRWR